MPRKNKPAPVRQLTLKPVYDSAKPYQWEPDQLFTLTGLQLQQILLSIQNNLNTSEGKIVLQQLESFKICQSLLKKGVEEGYVVEVKANDNKRS